MLCLGVDLCASPSRASTLALINGDGELTELTLFKEYEELLSILEENSPSVIAIDAPLGLPLGLDCLEEDCLCSPVNQHKGRIAEVELAKMGIGCFYTGKKSIIKKLIYRGVKFRQNLNKQGHDVIEVYPYATKVMVFGDKIPSKSRPESLQHLRERLPILVPGAEPYMDRLNHDRSDAVLTAYTAYLHLKGETDSLGIPEESMISLPKLHSSASSDRSS